MAALSSHELFFLVVADILANVSQIFMSHAYRFAPAGQIAPVNYIAIIFAGVWGFLRWHEMPDLYSVIGFRHYFIGHPIMQSPVPKGKS